MFSRRQVFATAGAATSALFTSRVYADECTVFSSERQKNVTPDQAIQMLKDGNERFLAGKSIHCDLREQMRQSAGGQSPFAAVVACIDSRVPPELVFDQRIGDVFVARVAGNFVNDDIIGSLEFATKVAGAKAILVIGHSECGAIKGAIDKVKLGFLTQLLENINPAVDAVKGFEGERTAKNKAFVQAVANMNAQLSAKKLLDRSDVLRGLVEAQQLKIAPAMRDIKSGQITFL